jgi:hypothetical protein
MSAALPPSVADPARKGQRAVAGRALGLDLESAKGGTWPVRLIPRFRWLPEIYPRSDSATYPPPFHSGQAG